MYASPSCFKFLQYVLEFHGRYPLPFPVFHVVAAWKSEVANHQ